MRRIAWIASLAVLAAGCGGGGGGGGRSNKDVQGVWQYVDGPGLSGGEVTIGTKFLQLNPDGTGVLHGDLGGNVLACVDMIYAELSSTAVRVDVDDLFLTETYHYQKSGDTLTLTDSTGSTSHYSHTATVPAAANCGSVTEGSPIAIPTPPEDRTGLTAQGGNLFYTALSESQIVSVSPTGVAGPVYPTDSGQYRHLDAAEAADFWYDCGCGDLRDVERANNAGATVTNVNSLTLGHQIIIRGVAVDPANDHVWLSGGTDGFLEVQQPSTLVAFYPSTAPVRQIAFHAGSIWGLAGFGNLVTLAKIDVATGVATASYRLPRDRAWQGLTEVAGSLYLLEGVDNTAPGGQIVPITEGS
jgi:hypothetical protein